jgi:acyl-CoA thioester hydrolase
MSNLIETYRGVVYPWHCDHMGHMNVMWYVGKFDEATWQLMTHVGITRDYLVSQKRAMAAVDQRISYQSELLAGDSVVIRSGLIEVRDKVTRFVHEMRDAATDKLAARTLLTGVHMDAEKRRVCPMPAEIIERAQSLLIDYDTDW